MAGINLTLLIVLSSLLLIGMHVSADEREFCKEGLTKGEKLGLVQNVVCQNFISDATNQIQQYRIPKYPALHVSRALNLCCTAQKCDALANMENLVCHIKDYGLKRR